jgi:hypothetical protein
MKPKYLIAQIFWSFFAALMTVSLSAGQSATKHDSLILPVDKDTVVRFFYLPANDYLHPALIFRVAESGSPRLNTAPITNRGGRTPYISAEEMQSLIKMLDRSNLSWHETKTVEVPKMVGFRETTGKMEIKIFSSGGTALSLSDPVNLCETLAPFDAALKQPRALWEFQLFRVDYHCEVPGFNRNAFPAHDEGNQ